MKEENAMNEHAEVKQETVDALANAIFYAGFGAIGRDQLTEALAKGTEEFQISHDTKINGDSVRGVLNFKRSDQDLDKVFFNSFDLLVKKEGKEETLQQKFPVYFGNKYTLKEGYNLLDGRSVNKTFTKINPDDKNDRQTSEAWVYLDFKNVDDYGNYQVDRRYQFELEKQLEQYPIKGLEYPQNKKQLMDSLKKGDRVQVIMVTSRGEEKIKIEAAPRFGSMNLFDEQNKPIRLSLKKEEQEPGQEQSHTQGKSPDKTVIEAGKNNVTSEKNAQEPKNLPEGSNKQASDQKNKIEDQKNKNNNKGSRIKVG
ncbi:hypothetical protein [Sphingobacterium multivorum]|uniref:hypothetical protein n=1 Tax=Sphingobacterium multivorum TaxID=28454 RepID=UPI0028AC8F08|nr:hypothetical protein [Sphingobacterium multivorum]